MKYLQILLFVNNIAEGLSISYGSTVDLEIQIKGPGDALNLFSPAKKVSIDLKKCLPMQELIRFRYLLNFGRMSSLVNNVSVEIIPGKNKTK